VQPVSARNDLARITLAIVFILTLLGLCIWIARPFLPAIAWAMTLVIATWPIMLKLQARLWNKRGLAVAGMTCGLLLILVVLFAPKGIYGSAAAYLSRRREVGR